LKHEHGLARLRVRRLQRVQLHTDLTLLARLAKRSLGREPYRSRLQRCFAQRDRSALREHGGDSTMSIVVRFTGAPSVTKQQYDEGLRRLESSGDFPPDGLEYHVAFGADGNFRVSEIWDSQEKFETFGQRLMPILAELGIELAGEPEIFEVHNIIKR
jgi:hypothetical protein